MNSQFIVFVIPMRVLLTPGSECTGVTFQCVTYIMFNVNVRIFVYINIYVEL